MKKKAVIILFIVLCLFTTIEAYAGTSTIHTLRQQKIYITLRPDVTVELKGIKQTFRDVKGHIIYPVVYNGSTYLPVRAVSGLMKKEIEWDAASKTVFIGKTLSNPSGAVYHSNASSESEHNLVSTSNIMPKSEFVSAYLKPDILVMYDFELQYFEDVNGKQVYPIIYNGSTFLPVRAISRLMNESIEWDGISNTVKIGTVEAAGGVDVQEPINELSAAAKNLKNIFEREEVLYYEATSKTTNLKTAISLDEKQLIATTISDNYLNAQKLTAEINAVDDSSYTVDQKESYGKLKSFAESNEYYILILENISYLAASDADYSMLADTFLYFALEAQTKMEDARKSIQSLE